MIKKLENHFNGKYNKYYVDVCSSYIELAYMIKNSDIEIMFVDVDEGVERNMQTVSRHYGLEEFINMSSYIASAAYDMEKLSFLFLGSLHNRSIMITARSTENPLVTLSSEEELELEDILGGKTMEFRKKCAHVFRTILGWFLIVQGGLWGISGGICAIVALFGGMKFNSFGDRLLFFVISLVMVVGSFAILQLGMRLKNGGRKEKTISPTKRKSSPAKQKETQQDRNEQRLQGEKEENQWAACAGEITLQGVLNTFSIEEQQRFKNQTYQYSQDTGRAGLSPEIAAANRGMVLVNGSPVPKEVVARRDTMRNCVSELLTLGNSWSGRAEHGEEKLTLMHEDDIYRLKLTSCEWNDAGGCSTPQANSTKFVGELKLTEHQRWTVSGFLFHAETLYGLPVWAAEKLTREKVFTELFTSPYGSCMEKTGRVYWSNWCSPNVEYSFTWFEKQDNMWHAHSDVRVGGIQIKKDTPLPDVTDTNIARCLELDPMIYLYRPDIENWIRRERYGEVTLYHQIEEKDSTDEHHIIYTIDPRNGALYYYEGFPWNRAAPEEARPATYAELAQTDSRYTGMTIQNWEKYLPKDNSTGVYEKTEREGNIENMLDAAE